MNKTNLFSIKSSVSLLGSFIAFIKLIFLISIFRIHTQPCADACDTLYMYTKHCHGLLLELPHLETGIWWTWGILENSMCQVAPSESLNP